MFDSGIFEQNSYTCAIYYDKMYLGTDAGSEISDQLSYTQTNHNTKFADVHVNKKT